jgi:hypothetical protein
MISMTYWLKTLSFRQGAHWQLFTVISLAWLVVRDTCDAAFAHAAWLIIVVQIVGHGRSR